MGGSESRCCKEKSLKTSESYGTGYDNKAAVTRTPSKTTVAASFDPRSPSQDFVRTPVEIDCSPICKKPLSRVQPIPNERSQLRNRNPGSKADGDSNEEATSVVYHSNEEECSRAIPDPRSPNCDGIRTPIVHKFTNRSSEKACAKLTLLDPRSPSDGIPRTPIDFADDEENALPDENINVKKTTTPVKPRRSNLDSDSKQDSKTCIGTPKIDLDPRSPSFSVQRTPLAEVERNKSDPSDITQTVARNLNDPRSPTAEVSRSPLSVIFGGARNLRRSVLMTNALLASPLNKKLSPSNPESTTAEKDSKSETYNVAEDVVEVVDVLPDILCSVNMLDVSCSSSMVASIGSEVDCLTLDYDESETSCQDVDLSAGAEGVLKRDKIVQAAVEIDGIPSDFIADSAEGQIEREDWLLCGTGSDELRDAQVQSTLSNESEAPILVPLPAQGSDMVQICAQVDVIAESQPAVGDEADRESRLCETEKTVRDVLRTSEEMTDIQLMTEIKCADDTATDPNRIGTDNEFPQLYRDNGKSMSEHVDPSPSQDNLKILEETNGHEDDDKFLSDALEEFRDAPDRVTYADERLEEALAAIDTDIAGILERVLDEPEMLANETESVRMFNGETEPVPQFDDVTKSQSSAALADGPNAENKTADMNMSEENNVDICSADVTSKSPAADINGLASSVAGKATNSTMSESSINTCSDSFDAQEANVPATTTGSASSPGPMQGSRRPSGKLRIPSAIPQRRKSLSVGSEPEFTTYSVASGSKNANNINAGVAKGFQLKKKTKSSSISEAHPASEISRQDKNQSQKHRVGSKFSSLNKSETKLTRPGRSPLAVLSHENKSPTAEFQKTSTALKTHSKSTKLPRYQGTPPITVNRSLSLSTSGNTAKRTRSTDRSRVANRRSFNYGKEN